MSNILKEMVVEHVCLPSTNPDASVAFLVKFGATLIKKIPDGPQFILVSGQIFEILQVDEDQMLTPSVCHIAIPAKTPADVNRIVRVMITDCTIYEYVEKDELTYVLLKIPGGIGIQVIYRQTPLLPTS